MPRPSVEEQFLTAYDILADTLYRHASFRVRDHEIAKELVQETFMRGWKQLSEKGSVDNLRAFLYRILNNLIIDRARTLHPADSLQILQEAGWEPSEGGREKERIIADLEAEGLLGAIRSLDEPYKTAFLMRYIDELSPREIAKALEESANVISVRINRAKSMLREALKKKYVS